MPGAIAVLSLAGFRTPKEGKTMKILSPTGTMALILLCATAMSAVVTPARAQPLAGKDTCGADVNTPPSTIDLATQGHRIRNAILCLINAERTSRGLAALSANSKLASAADGHVQRAVTLKWWGESDPHVDPQVDVVPGTNPPTPLGRNEAIAARINRAGYCPEGATFVSEIAKDGAGTNVTECPPGACSTPFFAVHWWMNISTAGHREAILNPAIKEIGVGVRGDVANKDPAQNAQSEKGAYVVNFGACPYIVQPPPPPPPDGQTRVEVTFTKMHVNDCPEAGICDWKLTCRLGNQQETEFFTMVEINTGKDRDIKRMLAQDGVLPVSVTCTVKERDGPFLFFDDPVWEHVGTSTASIQVSGKHDIRINQNSDEGDVTVHLDVKQLGSTAGGLTQQPSPPPVPIGCHIPEGSAPTCGYMSIVCNAPLPMADEMVVMAGSGFTTEVYRVVSDIGLINAEYGGEGNAVLAVCAKNSRGMSCGEGFFATLGPTICPYSPPPPTCPHGQFICPSRGGVCKPITDCPPLL